MLWILGDEFDHAVDEGQRPLLRRLSRLLVGMGVVGVALLPVSGFWLPLGLGLMAWIGLLPPCRRAEPAP